MVIIYRAAKLVSKRLQNVFNLIVFECNACCICMIQGFMFAQVLEMDELNDPSDWEDVDVSLVVGANDTEAGPHKTYTQRRRYLFSYVIAERLHSSDPLRP